MKVKKQQKLALPKRSEGEQTTVKQQTVKHPSDEKPYLFKPGQSGNPKGRPLGSKNRLASSDLRRLAFEEQELLNKETGQKVKYSQSELIGMALIRKAKAGSERAMEIFFDRVDGKPKQSIEGELAITSRVVYLPEKKRDEQ